MMKGRTVLILALFATGSLLGCSAVPKKAYDNLQKKHDNLVEQYNTLQGKFHGIERQNKKLKKRLREYGESLEDFRNLASDLERNQQGGVKLDVPDGVRDQVKKVTVDGRTALRLSNPFFFQSGSDDLSEEGKKTINQIIPVLKEFKGNVELLVKGHTDNVPVEQSKEQFPTNWHLSASRAITVAKQLIRRGVTKNNVEVAALADTEPIASNDTEEGRRKNRRVEILLIPAS